MVLRISFGTARPTQEFTNSPLNGDDTDKTYGQSIVEAVISYFNGWMDTNEDESLIGVNSLEIGEIRSSGDGYLCFDFCHICCCQRGYCKRKETVHLTKITDRSRLQMLRRKLFEQWEKQKDGYSIAILVIVGAVSAVAPA